MTGTAPINADSILPAYNYAGVPLTPKVIIGLAPTLMTDSLFRRADLIAVVESYHVSRGGLPSRSTVSWQVKKALLWLVERRMLEPSGWQGTWQWTDAAPDLGLAPAADSGDLSGGETLPINDVAAEGKGQGSLYVYFYPYSKELAVYRGEKMWPVKVGMTAAGDAKIRIAAQLSAATLEKPLLAYVRRTDTPRPLEAAVHNILFLRGRHIDEAVGQEWFMSTPEEIKKIVDWVLGEPSPPGTNLSS